MLINKANLDGLRAGFSTAFQGGLGMAPSFWNKVAMEVKATQMEQKYGWLGQIPNVREWIGARAIQNLEQHDYTIAEKPFEQTVSVNRDHVETDNLGMYGPMFTELGRSAAAFPDQLTFGLLENGFDEECYDGQGFFDADHPVLDSSGKQSTVSNTGGGTGSFWCLMDTTRAVKPLIVQKRKGFEKLVSKDRDEDNNVFDENKYVYGSDARMNAGFGFWQMAYGSKQTLDDTAYEEARAALSGMKGDYERPLGLTPNLLVVSPTLEGAGRRLLNNQTKNGGDTNEWMGTAELLVVPWLS